jgi:hypothetical protein
VVEADLTICGEHSSGKFTYIATYVLKYTLKIDLLSLGRNSSMFIFSPREKIFRFRVKLYETGHKYFANPGNQSFTFRWIIAYSGACNTTFVKQKPVFCM